MSNENDPARLEQADDRIVAGRAADGDTAAFAVLVRRHTPMMRAYARRVLAGSADLDDVVQDALISAWEQLPRLEDPGKVRGWLMRITSRKALDRVRAAHPHLGLDRIEPVGPSRDAPARRAEANAGVSALNLALAGLPDEQRQCWVLRELGGYSYEEIGEQLDLSVSTVRGMLARARKTIIGQMEEWR